MGTIPNRKIFLAGNLTLLALPVLEGTGIDFPPDKMPSKRPFYVEPFAIFLAYVMALPPGAAAQPPVPQPPAPQQTVIPAPVKTAPAEVTAWQFPAPPAKVRQPDPAILRPVQPQSIPGNCTVLGGSYIIQYVCSGNSMSGSTPPSGSLVSAIQQFESDSIKQWLALYNLPNSDTDVANFYTYARSATRNSVRAYMKLRLIDIAFRMEKNNAVTANEQTVYSWFQGRVQARRILMDQDAVNNKNNFQNNRCTWQPDPNLEKTYGFAYIPCVGTEIFDTAPNADYFVGAALKQDFSDFLISLKPSNLTSLRAAVSAASGMVPHDSGSNNSSNTPSGVTMFGSTQDEQAKLIQTYGGATGGVLGAAVATALLSISVPKIRYKIFPNTKKSEYLNKQRSKPKSKNDDMKQRIKENSDDAEKDATDAGDTVVKDGATDVSNDVTTQGAKEELTKIGARDAEAGEDSAEAGPEGLIIGLVIVVVVTIVSIIVDEAVAENSLTSLDTALNNERAAAPDLYKLYQDNTGSYQIDVCWTEVTWPDSPSTTPLPSATASSVVVSYPNGQPSNYAVDGLTYFDWYGGQVQLEAYGPWLLKFGTFKIPNTSTVVSGSEMNHNIEFYDWNGDPYWASRVGNGFIVGKRFISQSDVDCPAGLSGVTEQSDLTNCSTFVTDKVQLVDTNNNAAVLSIANLPAWNPASTSLSFNTNETPLTVSIPISSYPTPTISVDPSSSLHGIALDTSQLSTGILNLVFNGANVFTGNYFVTLHAKNFAGDTPETFAVSVTGPDYAMPPSWDDATNALPAQTWTTGVPFQITLHATSAYAMSFTTNLAMPKGIHISTVPGSNAFVVFGAPDATTAGATAYTSTTDSAPPYVKACDGQNRCIEYGLVFTIKQAPAAHFTNVTYPIQLDYPVGQQRNYTLTTAGAITPVSFSVCPSFPLPSWATAVDNGNGSVTIYGNAPGNNGVESVFESSIAIHTVGVIDPPCNTNNLNIFQDSYPQLFTNNYTITAGSNAGIFLDTNVDPSVGTITTTSPIPAGMQFYGPFGGNPWSIGGNPSPGSGGQYRVTLVMTPGPGIPSATQDLVINVNEAPSLNLPSTVYMMAGVNNQYVVKPGGFPAYNAMSVTNTGALPPGVVFSKGSFINSNVGTGTYTGTPALSTAGQSFPITITANNGVGTQAVQGTILHVVPAGDVTHDDVVDCNDIALIKAHYLAKAGTAKYLGAADLNNDGVINLLDLNFVTTHLQSGTVCH